MAILTTATLSQAQERLMAMVGPVVLRVPQGNPAMRALAEELLGAVGGGDDGLLTSEEWEGESLTLLDGWGRETGVHFRDLPVGQEFGALVDAILAASKGGNILTPLGRGQAQALPEGSTLWVFVTPTCPRCSQAVRLVNEMALESRGRLTVTMIDLTNHPELMERFAVNTVPYFVVGGDLGFPGPQPELILLQRIADHPVA